MDHDAKLGRAACRAGNLRADDRQLAHETVKYRVRNNEEENKGDDKFLVVHCTIILDINYFQVGEKQDCLN